MKMTSVFAPAGAADRSGRGARRRLATVAALCLLALACGQSTPEELMQSAEEMLASNDVLGAQLKFEELLERHPDSPLVTEARMGLAACFMMDRDFGQARRQYEAILEATEGPHTPEGFRALDGIFYTLVQEKRTTDALERALATSPSMARAPEDGRFAFQLKLTELFLINRMEEEAIEICKDLLAQGPSSEARHSQPLDRIVQIYAQDEQYDQAARVYRDYLERYPDTPMEPMVYFGLASVEQLAGNEAAAEAAFARSEQIIDERIEQALGAREKSRLMLRLSRMQRFRDQNEAASQTLRRIIEQFPGSGFDAEAKLQMAEMAWRQQQVQTTIGLLEDVARTAPPNSNLANTAMQSLQQISMTLQRQAAGEPGMGAPAAVAPASSPTLAADTPATETEAGAFP